MKAGETYTGHEETEHTTEGEAHTAGHDGFEWTGFHCGVHLRTTLAIFASRYNLQLQAYTLDHHLFLLTHSLHVGTSSNAAHRRGHVWETHGVDLGGGGECGCVGFEVGFAIIWGQSCRKSGSGACPYASRRHKRLYIRIEDNET